MKLLRDSWLILQREGVLAWRQRLRLLLNIVQPIMYLLLFAPLLKPALRGQLGADANAYQVFVPGLLVMMAIFGGLFQGFGLIMEVRTGIIERWRVTPTSSLAVLLGHSLLHAVQLLLQAGLITVVALFFGLTVHLVDLLLAFSILALVALMTSAVSYALALSLRHEGALGPLTNTVSQPLFLLSGILLPLTLAPPILQHVAFFNPFWWAVEGTRAAFAGDVGSVRVWQSLLIIGVLTIVSSTWAARSFARNEG